MYRTINKAKHEEMHNIKGNNINDKYNPDIK